jgi:hypothetical protein
VSEQQQASLSIAAEIQLLTARAHYRYVACLHGCLAVVSVCSSTSLSTSLSPNHPSARDRSDWPLRAAQSARLWSCEGRALPVVDWDVEHL